MNEIELKLRKLAERIEKLTLSDLDSSEELVSELDKKVQKLESFYEGPVQVSTGQ